MSWQVAAWILVVLMAAYAIFFPPKFDPPKAASLEDFDMPTAEEGRAIPVVLGTRQISAPNVVWYGDLKISKIKKGKK